MSSQRRRTRRKRPHLQVPPAYRTLGSPSSHGHSGSSTQLDGSFQGPESLTKKNDARTRTWNKRIGRSRRAMTIDILPEEVLLEIFDFLVVESNGLEADRAEDWWRILVHVCRKWRNVIFGSPHRLNLRLICSNRTPAREMLDIWPPFPVIIIHHHIHYLGWDNAIAALERNNRVSQINMKLNLPWKKVLDAMQEPFPALTHLTLSSDIEIPPVVPDSFMGGSVPRLQYLWLDRVRFPGLPKLLLSATGLIRLDLLRIPGYISPEAIVTCLSTLPRLETLHLEFESPLSRPICESRRPPRSTRSVLPALISLRFKGVSEYLEDLVARVDSPLLDYLGIKLFSQLIFDTPQLTQFISRTPTLKVHDIAHVDFTDIDVFGAAFLKPCTFVSYRSSCYLAGSRTGNFRLCPFQELVGGRTKEVLPPL